MQTAPTTRKAHRREKIAKTVIWISVFLTIGVLAWIVLYVMIRGFYSDQQVVYEVTDIQEETVDLGSDVDEDMQIIVHRGVRAKDLTVEALRTLYTKSRQEKWGHYTQQDLRASPIAFEPTTPFATEAFRLIVGPGDEEQLGDYVKYATDPAEVVAFVSENKGAVGYIPAGSVEDLRGVKTVPLRRVSAAVHPSVREIVDNVQLQRLSTDQLQAIFQGQVTNWQQVDGIDLPVRPVLMSSDDPVMGFILGSLLGESARISDAIHVVSSPDEFCSYLQNTRGAIGLCFFDSALSRELAVLDVVRREVGWNLDLHFIIEPPARSGQWGGISYIIINTFFLVLFTLLFSTPIGVLAAVYLVEYAKQGRLVRFLRMGTETLAGVPSIVFGLFGSIFFVNILNMGIGFISSTLTVTMMILPTITRTSEEALKSVPLSYREGSMALGGTKLQTIFKVVVPAAIPGILTGIILGVGRVVGETAVLLYTLGSNYELVRGPSSSARVLSLHLYFLFSEAISFERAFATGAIIVFIVLIVNYGTTKLIGRMNRMAGA
jgi:phosphate transport system permease protein